MYIYVLTTCTYLYTVTLKHKPMFWNKLSRHNSHMSHAEHSSHVTTMCGTNTHSWANAFHLPSSVLPVAAAVAEMFIALFMLRWMMSVLLVYSDIPFMIHSLACTVHLISLSTIYLGNVYPRLALSKDPASMIHSSNDTQPKDTNTMVQDHSLCVCVCWVK